MDSKELGEYDSSEGDAYTSADSGKVEPCIGEACCTVGMVYDNTGWYGRSSFEASCSLSAPAKRPQHDSGIKQS